MSSNDKGKMQNIKKPSRKCHRDRVGIGLNEIRDRKQSDYEQSKTLIFAKGARKNTSSSFACKNIFRSLFYISIFKIWY